MTAAAPQQDHTLELLHAERDRAERTLNALRACVLALLGIAALVYAPSLTPALNLANVLVLASLLCWTVLQYVLLYRRERLPEWLFLANPVLDALAVTLILAGYGLAQSAALALQSPIFLAYFVILAARPIASSTRIAGVVAGLLVLLYAALLALFAATGRVAIEVNPVAALSDEAVSPLNEGAKILLLAVSGSIATYATAWHERIATRYFRQAQERRELEVRLMHAQLESLKLQLHPHFLFNTLNNITTLIGENPLAAERMVNGLSELLRLSLHMAGEQEISLARELEFIGHYAAIQQLRFGDALRITVEADPDIGNAMVPTFILQPLVENAVKHGLAPRGGAGHIQVVVKRSGTRLQLAVHDDGVGPGSSGSSTGGGTGLGNTRARLVYLYGNEHSIAAEGKAGSGFRVDIEFPLRLTQA